MAYDADGTVVISAKPIASPMVEVAGAVTVLMNDESNTNNGSLTGGTSGGLERRLAWVFPELREFDGFFGSSLQGSANRLLTLASSGDTTNGVDGTWTTRLADVATGCGNSTTTYDNYRDEIFSVAVGNVRGVRLLVQVDQNQFQSGHIYGEISPGETPDRLLWIDNTTGLEFNLPIDYGDIPRGSAEDRELKLKNNSASLTAASVQITAEALYLASGAWYTFSEGAAFQSTLALAASIGAGASTSTITIRRDTPDSETVGLHAARVYTAVGTWS